jgi:hypothetical protein
MYDMLTGAVSWGAYVQHAHWSGKLGVLMYDMLTGAVSSHHARCQFHWQLEIIATSIFTCLYLETFLLCKGERHLYIHVITYLDNQK